MRRPCWRCGTSWTRSSGRAGGVDLGFAVSERLRAQLAADPARFLGPRAAAWARTAPPEQAEVHAGDLVRRAPHEVGGHVLLALLQARQGRFDDAAGVLAEAAHRFPDAPDVVLAQRRLAAARQLAEAPVSTALDGALRDARVLLALGSPAGARRALGAAPPEDAGPERVLVAVQIEVADRRFDAARDLLDAAARRDPAQAGLWQAARDRVAEAEAREARR